MLGWSELIVSPVTKTEKIQPQPIRDWEHGVGSVVSLVGSLERPGSRRFYGFR
jgi:hypothetical protein